MWQGSKYARITQGPEKALHYRYLIVALVFKWRGVTESSEFCVKCILKIHNILNAPQILNMPRF